MHVSTAYCNCDRSDIAEMIYTPPYSPDDIISLVQWLPEDLLDKVCDVMILILNTEFFNLCLFLLQ